MLLVIDTTGRLLAFGLYDKAAEPVLRHIEDAPMRQVERLFPALCEAIEARGLARGAITRIGAVAGPGSYTGIRAGLAAAAGLERALGAPALGIGALEALASAAAGDGQPMDSFLAAVPVGRGRFAAQRAERRGEEVRLLGDVAWVDARELAEHGSATPVVIAQEAEEAGDLPGARRVPMAARLDAAARLLLPADPATRPLRPLYLRAVQLGPKQRAGNP